MKDNIFLDTNMFVYLYSEDEPLKQAVVEEIINYIKPIISIQVLNELSNTLRKKFQKEFDEIENVIDEISENCTIEIIDELTVRSALAIAKKYKYHYYDSLIIASALENNCSILYSEDMQDGQIIEKRLKIVNPFSSVHKE